MSKDDWKEYQKEESNRSMFLLKQGLSECFSLHQEEMLLPTTGKVPKKEIPQIFNKVINEFPVDTYAMVMFNVETKNEAKEKPPLQELIYSKPNFDINDYFPDLGSMSSLFWGKYLNELVPQKGYQLKYIGDQLWFLVNEGSDALIDGIDLFRKKLS